MRCLAILLVSAVAMAGAPIMKTQTWKSSQPAFEEFARQIEGNFPRNLLARRGVRFVKDGKVGPAGVQMLTDGSAGELGDAGRVNIEGMPAVFVVYLGQPKAITEVAVYTCNIDSRSNQDFEIRVADNSKNPGKAPKFPKAPTFTSGPKILGADRGGVCTRFAADGTPIVAGTIDWIEFRVWRTYGLKAGQPAKTKKATGWTALTELEVLGAKDDLLPQKEIERLAAIRKAPTKPAYEKKATWFETMVAAREAIVAWETEQDLLALSEGVASFGPWHTAGPFAAKSDQAQAVIRLRSVTFPQTPVKKADPIIWTKRDDIPTGQLVDLAPLLKAKPGQVIALCRTLKTEHKTDGRHPFAIGLGIGEGRMHIAQLNRSVAGSPGQPAGPNQVTWNLQLEPGECHIVARLPVTADGACKLWFTPQASTIRPGAGDARKRVARREALYAQLLKDFPDPVSAAQINWERADSIWIPFTRRGMARIEKHVADWPTGNLHFLAGQYNGAVPGRLAALEADVAVAPRAVQAQIAPWLAKAKTEAAPTTTEKARARYYRLASIQECAAVANRLYAMRLAVEDQRETFGADYARGAEHLARVAALEGTLATTLKATMDELFAAKGDDIRAAVTLRDEIATAQRTILLDNPILRGQKLMVGTSLRFSSNWGGPNSLGNEIRVLDPSKPDPETTTLFKLPSGSMSNFDLSWDAKRILYSNGRHLFEVVVGETTPRQITSQTDPHVRHYDPVYLPSGDIVFVSTACEQAVPCTGGWYVGNLHFIRADGAGERRLTFDQDHDWNPTVLNSGRVVYTRWE
ncbi:hypothetical protein HQ560_10405, partial [bacterium]|nr:hypothetical protein [bacterium]